jgi:hypothetical protein
VAKDPFFDVQKALDEVIGKKWKDEAPAAERLKARLVKWALGAIVGVSLAALVVIVLEKNKPAPGAPKAPAKPVVIQVIPKKDAPAN